MFNRMVSCFLVFGFLVSISSPGFSELRCVVVPAQKTFVSAETRLKEFVAKDKETRLLTAMCGIGSGLLYIGLGAASSKSYYSTDNSSIYYAMGVGMGLLGVASLIFPTELENNFAKLKMMPDTSIEDRASRERFSEQTFKYGAEETNRGRVLGAAAITGLGIGTISSGIGILFVALGAMTYVVKSEIENGYDEYVSDKEEFLASRSLAQQTSSSSSEGARDEQSNVRQ